MSDQEQNVDLQSIKKYFATHDQYAAYSGIELVAVGPGTARAEMVVQEHHLNSVRSTHGGAIFTLADFAFAAACNAHGRVSVGVQVSISYMQATTVGDRLIVEVEEQSCSYKLGNYVARVTEAESGKLVAVFNGMAYRKSAEYPPADFTDA